MFKFITDIVDKTSTPIKLLALIVVLIFLAFMFKPEHHNPQCKISIDSHKNNDIVDSSVLLTGTSTNCNKKNVIYMLALRDFEGGYYRQGDNLAFSNKSGGWSNTVYFSPSWHGKEATVMAISYPDTVSWQESDPELRSLPNNYVSYAFVILNVKPVSQ